MSKELTNTQLNKLLGKRHDTAFPLKDRDSLGVLVGMKGGIRWQYRFRINGKPQRLLMGMYPEMSIAEARGYIPKIKNWLSLGQDPRVEWEKLFTPEVEAKGITLVELCEKWFDAYAQTNLKEKTTNNYLCHLEVWVYNKPRRKVLDEPWALNNFACPFDSIPNGQWFPYFDWITRNSSGTKAGAVYKILKTVISWGIKRHHIHNRYFLELNLPDVGAYPKARERTPTFLELALLWREVELSRAEPQTKACIKILMILGNRHSAIRGAKWCDIDFEEGVWRIPEPKGQRVRQTRGAHQDDKEGTEPETHPIPNKVQEILLNLGELTGTDGYVFKGYRGKSPVTMPAVNRVRQRCVQNLFERYGIRYFITHDFRRSLMTNLKELQPELEAVYRKMLGHKLKGTQKHYDLATNMEKQLASYELYWGKLCGQLEFIRAAPKYKI